MLLVPIAFRATFDGRLRGGRRIDIPNAIDYRRAEDAGFEKA